MPVIYSWGNARWVDPRFPLINLLSCRLQPHFPDKLLVAMEQGLPSVCTGARQIRGYFLAGRGGATFAEG